MNLLSNSLLLLVCFFICTSGVNGQVDSLATSNSSEKYLKPEKVSTDISVLTPPEGFSISESFDGYIHLQAASAIVIMELANINYITLDKSKNSKYYERNNLTFIESKDIVTVNGDKGKFYKSSFIIDDIKYYRLTAYIGDLNNTLWIAITYPEIMEPILLDELMKSIESVNFKKNRDEK